MLLGLEMPSMLSQTEAKERYLNSKVEHKHTTPWLKQTTTKTTKLF